MTVYRRDAMIVHIPKTGGASIAKAFGLQDTHKSAVYRRALDPEAWDCAFTFSIVRNPWERVVSWWLNTQTYTHTPFLDWVAQGMPAGPIFGLDGAQQWHYIADEKRRPMVRMLYDFGHLEQAYTDLATIIGGPLEPLPRIHEKTYPNRGFLSSGGRQPWKYYWEGRSDLAEEVAALDPEIIEAFGYAFEDEGEIPVKVDLGPPRPTVQ